MSSTTNGFPKQWRIRVKDSLGERHNVLAFGNTERQAMLAGLKLARRLLEDPKAELVWCKPV